MNNLISNPLKWAIGLIEAEGYIGFNLNSPVKKTWTIILKVSMKKNNARAIYKLKSIFGVGKVHRSSDGMITYKVTDRTKLKSVILPIFEIYPFRGKKYYDYLIFKKALDIVESNLTQGEKHELLLKLKEDGRLSKRRISIVYQLPDSVENLEDSEILKLVSREQLMNVFDPDWIAGFVEGDGSLQINKRLQVEFSLGQTHDPFTVFALHKYFNVPSKIKIRKDLSYTVLNTKHPRVIKDIIRTISGRLLGTKSFEFKLWTYAFNTSLKHKKEKAKFVLNKIRN